MSGRRRVRDDVEHVLAVLHLAAGSKLMPAYYIIAAALLSIMVVGSTLGAVRRAAMVRP